MNGKRNKNHPLQLIVIKLSNGKVVDVKLHSDGSTKEIAGFQLDPISEFTRIAELYPNAYIAWFEDTIGHYISDVIDWPGLITHPFEVLHISCFQRSDLTAYYLGLVDFSSPFLLPGPLDKRYPTWLISSNAGILYTGLILAIPFDPTLHQFSICLFEWGHRASSQGVCIYSEPGLLRKDIELPKTVAFEVLPLEQEALLVKEIYGYKWVLAWMIGRLLLGKKCINLKILLILLTKSQSNVVNHSLLEHYRPQLNDKNVQFETVDAIIPTLNRKDHVLNLLSDLNNQSFPLNKIIIIEQIPDNADGIVPLDISELKTKFEIDRIRINTIGVCHARNIGVKRSSAKWLLLLDDDIRLLPDFLLDQLKVSTAYNVDVAIGATYLPTQVKEQVVLSRFPVVWSGFAGGTALITRKVWIEAGGMDEKIEGGYGEDNEFGIRVRQSGSNVLYNPYQPVLHMKASTGGFRYTFSHPWKSEKPKPSPTVLYSLQKHSTEAMKKGFKMLYWSKRLLNTPFYKILFQLSQINREWNSAEKWSEWIAHRT